MENGLRCSKSIRSIWSLDPLIDDSGHIRVGGRFKNADIPCAHEHPLILFSKYFSHISITKKIKAITISKPATSKKIQKLLDSKQL